MAHSSTNASGVDNTYRRKWNREEYLERAPERELQVRKRKAGLRPKVVTPVAPLSQQAGYYCDVCECVVKDSANFLDHINGEKHQRALGMSMRVERASLQQVQERLNSLRSRKPVEPLLGKLLNAFYLPNLSARILKQQQERKKERRERKKEQRKEKAAEDDVEDDADVAAMMGFGGFRSSKKS